MNKIHCLLIVQDTSTCSYSTCEGKISHIITVNIYIQVITNSSCVYRRGYAMKRQLLLASRTETYIETLISGFNVAILSVVIGIYRAASELKYKKNISNNSWQQKPIGWKRLRAQITHTMSILSKINSETFVQLYKYFRQSYEKSN